MRGAAVVVSLLAACTDAASSNPGLDAILQVPGAQFRPGPFPADEGGPDALSIRTRSTIVRIDRLDEQVRAVLEPAARGAAIGIPGVDGAWIVAAGVPELDTPGLPSARADFGVTSALPAGPFTLTVAATGVEGRYGAPAAMQLVAEEVPPPAGELVIGLLWDGAADLDIHVVDPLGGEAWSDDPNTWVLPPPGEPVDPDAWRTGGILEHDGNKDCHRDGHPEEYVVWQLPQPQGSYTVRVDARAMCGDAAAPWYVAAYRGGVLIDAARGIATPEDVLQPHGAGAGVLALRFTCDAAGVCTAP